MPRSRDEQALTSDMFLILPTRRPHFAAQLPAEPCNTAHAASTLRPSPGRKTATAAALGPPEPVHPRPSGGPCGPSNAPLPGAIEYPVQRRAQHGAYVLGRCSTHVYTRINKASSQTGVRKGPRANPRAKSLGASTRVVTQGEPRHRLTELIARAGFR